MVAPPRPVPTTSTAAAGELIVPTARRHRATDSSPPTGLSPTQRPTVTKVVAEEATLTTLLAAAEQLLQSLAKVEAATSPANGLGQVLPLQNLANAVELQVRERSGSGMIVGNRHHHRPRDRGRCGGDQRVQSLFALQPAAPAAPCLATYLPVSEVQVCSPFATAAWEKCISRASPRTGPMFPQQEHLPSSGAPAFSFPAVHAQQIGGSGPETFTRDEVARGYTLIRISHSWATSLCRGSRATSAHSCVSTEYSKLSRH
jgi:hypothetical protein